MDTSNLIDGLALFTLLTVLAFAVWQYVRTRKAIARHERSATPPHEGRRQKARTDL
jgi:hypothetical protein